jgi:hypothetical protein
MKHIPATTASNEHEISGEGPLWDAPHAPDRCHRCADDTLVGRAGFDNGRLNIQLTQQEHPCI